MAKNIGLRRVDGGGVAAVLEPPPPANRFVPRAVWRFDPAAKQEHPAVTGDGRFVGGVRPPDMSPEQLGAYHRLLRYARGECVEPGAAAGDLAGRVAILTGIAGSGKSTVVRWLRAAHPELFTVCATTGSAAVLVGGATVDRLFAFRRDTSDDPDRPWDWSVDRLDRNMTRECGPCIVVDEASMIGDRMAEVIETALSFHPKRIILVGDWAQARPVKDGWPFGRDLFRKAELVRLTQCHRQDDPEYLAALDRVRNGDPIPEYFARRVAETPPDDDACIHAYATNKAADQHNLRRYGQLRAEKGGGDERRLVCRVAMFDVDREGRPSRERPSRLPERVVEAAIQDSRLAHCLDIRPDARALVVRNGAGLAYVNGDTGTVEGFSAAGDVAVRLDRTGQPVSVARAYVEIPDAALLRHPNCAREWFLSPEERAEAARGHPGQYDRTAHFVVGYPLRYGWAVTIHRTQGMTLPRLYARLETIYRMPPDSRHGMAYVALSRTDRIDGLYLDNHAARVVERDPAVLGLV